MRQLRLNLLVHSYIYYHLDDSLISDHQWQACADELAERQKTFTRRIGCYDDAFKDWTGSTGFHLPVDAWVRQKASYLLRLFGRTPAPQQPPTIKRKALAPASQPRKSIFDL